MGPTQETKLKSIPTINLKQLVMKLKSPKKLNFPPKELKLEQKEEKLNLLSKTMEMGPQIEQKALSEPIASQQIIAIGGCGQDGRSLTSVEGFSLVGDRWVWLPAMNIPRSFLSSVVADQQVIVSGGNTGDAITDTIEVLNFAETPLQWKISLARLPVPLCAHQTVVYGGKLIVIGGHDGNSASSSDKIYEVLLAPPYTFRILTTLFSPVEWHGVSLVSNELFIFGGCKRSGFPISHVDVFAYDLLRNTLRQTERLPYAIQGIATVTRGQSVVIVGGLSGGDREIDTILMYDTRSGESRIISQMNMIRGICSAAITATSDCRSCRVHHLSDLLVVLGSSSPNTVEGYNFQSHTWKDLPPTSVARNFCSLIALEY